MTDAFANTGILRAPRLGFSKLIFLMSVSIFIVATFMTLIADAEEINPRELVNGYANAKSISIDSSPTFFLNLSQSMRAHEFQDTANFYELFADLWSDFQRRFNLPEDATSFDAILFEDNPKHFNYFKQRADIPKFKLRQLIAIAYAQQLFQLPSKSRRYDQEELKIEAALLGAKFETASRLYRIDGRDFQTIVKAKGFNPRKKRDLFGLWNHTFILNESGTLVSTSFSSGNEEIAFYVADRKIDVMANTRLYEYELQDVSGVRIASEYGTQVEAEFVTTEIELNQIRRYREIVIDRIDRKIRKIEPWIDVPQTQPASPQSISCERLFRGL